MTKAYSLRNCLLCLLFLSFFAVPLYSQDNQTEAAAAQKLQSEAEELLKKNTADASRQAVAKFTEARTLWQKTGNQQKEADTLVKLIEASSMTGEMRPALEYSKELLPIAQKLSNRLLEA